MFTVIDLDGDGADDTQIFARVDALSARSVPEPGTLALVFSGLLLLRWRTRTA